MKWCNEMMKLQPTPRSKVRGSEINVIGSPVPIKQNIQGGSLIIMPFSFTMLIYFLVLLLVLLQGKKKNQIPVS